MHQFHRLLPSLFLSFISFTHGQTLDLLVSIPTRESAALYPAYTYIPSVDANYKPQPEGPHLSHPNININPLSPSPVPTVAASPPTLPGLGSGSSPSSYWYEEITHNGISPFISNGTSWKVYRNVKDYGAQGDGFTDDASAIQAAIDDGDRGPGGNGFGTTGAPAVVYFPEGTYLMGEPLQSYVDTFLVGNPMVRPTLKASSPSMEQYFCI